jgi:hypothetical protein
MKCTKGEKLWEALTLQIEQLNVKIVPVAAEEFKERAKMICKYCALLLY